MSESKTPLKHAAKKEVALFVVLLFVGLVFLPMLVWFVGKAVFGAYGGHGFADFFGSLSARIRAGDGASWFLVLSPWLAIMVLRGMSWAWRAIGKM